MSLRARYTKPGDPDPEPLCAGNCTYNGVCVQPGTCKCFQGVHRPFVTAGLVHLACLCLGTDVRCRHILVLFCHMYASQHLVQNNHRELPLQKTADLFVCFCCSCCPVTGTADNKISHLAVQGSVGRSARGGWATWPWGAR